MPPSEGLVARDVSVGPGFDLGGRHDKRGWKKFGGFAEGVSGPQSPNVALENVTLEFAAEPTFGRVHRACVEPTQYAEREEILAAIDLALTQVETAEGFSVERRKGHFDELKAFAEIG